MTPEEIVNDESLNPWKAALIDALIVSCIYRKEHESDPKRALMELIDWETQIALDPAVSGDAVKLQNSGAERFRQERMKQIGWIAEVFTGRGTQVGYFADRSAIRQKLWVRPVYLYLERGFGVMPITLGKLVAHVAKQTRSESNSVAASTVDEGERNDPERGIV